MLGLTPPVQTTGETDGDLAELIDIWKRLGSEERKALLGMAGLVARPKQ